MPSSFVQNSLILRRRDAATRSRPDMDATAETNRGEGEGSTVTTASCMPATVLLSTNMDGGGDIRPSVFVAINVCNAASSGTKPDGVSC